MEKARERIAKVHRMATSVERFEDAHASYEFEAFVLREPSCSSISVNPAANSFARIIALTSPAPSPVRRRASSSATESFTEATSIQLAPAICLAPGRPAPATVTSA
jgi:hypothetical protein